MADINHSHVPLPVESDGVSYAGIFWFGVVLVVTAVVCQLLVWGLFRAMEWRVGRSDPALAPLAVKADPPSLENGKWKTGSEVRQAIPLLPSEPVVLRDFREQEDAILKNYDWIDKGAQKVRLPIDRAKELLLERGLPVRPAPAVAASTPDGQPATPDTAPPASAEAPRTH